VAQLSTLGHIAYELPSTTSRHELRRGQAGAFTGSASFAVSLHFRGACILSHILVGVTFVSVLVVFCPVAPSQPFFRPDSTIERFYLDDDTSSNQLPDSFAIS
jgi:hypothetical protein